MPNDRGGNVLTSPHEAFFEEPDILSLRLVGPVSAEDAREINRIHREGGEGRERLFFLVNLKELESIHPAARKETGATMKDMPIRGAALFEASLKARVIAKLILTAVNLFRSEEERMPICFFDTEVEARAWLQQRREELDRKRAA